MYLAIDGNSTGRIIEKLILLNKLDELASFSLEIQHAIQSACDEIVKQSGTIVMAGGDNVLATIPDSSYRAILSALKQLSTEKYSYSVSLSTTVQGAYYGLKYAKATKVKMVEVSITDGGQMFFREIISSDL